jgi:TRAP-type C4-dicarboxylate transport system permease small subunit
VKQFERWAERGLEASAGAAMFLMMTMTLVDVIGRKFFSRPLTGSVELTELLMVVALFFAMPLLSAHNQHIVFDVLDARLSPAWRRLQHVAAHLLAAGLFGAAGWIVAVRALRTMEFGDVTAQLRIPTGPFQMAIAALLVVSAVVHLGLAARAVPQPSPGYLHD